MKWPEFAFEDLVEGKSGLKRGPFGGAIKKEMFAPAGFKIYEQKNAIQDDCEIGSYFISEDKFKELEGFAVAPDDLLVRCSGTMGKVTIVPPDAKPGIINQALLRVRPRTSRVTSEFLRLLLESTLVQRRVFGAAAGVAIKNIRPLKEVRQVQIPVPPLAEQKRIAGILDAADGLRTKRRESLAQLDTLLQSTFLDMFGDPVSNPMGWEVAPLELLIEEDRPITYGILKPGPDIENGIPYVRVVDIQNEQVLTHQLRRTTEEIAAQYKRSRLQPGDLLMSIRGHVGRMAITPTEADGANITQDTARLALAGAEATYVMQCISTQGMQHYMARRTKGVAVRGINLGDVKKLLIPRAPLNLQGIWKILNYVKLPKTARFQRGRVVDL